MQRVTALGEAWFPATQVGSILGTLVESNNGNRENREGRAWLLRTEQEAQTKIGEASEA